MTDAEWLGARDPQRMLEHLCRPTNSRPAVTNRFLGWLGFSREAAPLPPAPSERKLRLLACGCCRRIWHRLTDHRSQRAVEIAEQFADDPGNSELRLELVQAMTAAYEVVDLDGLSRYNSHAAGLAAHFSSDPRFRFASYASMAAEHAAFPGGKMQQAAQAKLLLDIFGNPFRPVTIDAAWLTWRDATIPKLAQAAYDERELPSGHLDAKRLAILADALEEASCTNEDVLTHLRGPGPHVRGCWVVDLVLGRE